VSDRRRLAHRSTRDPRKHTQSRFRGSFRAGAVVGDVTACCRRLGCPAHRDQIWLELRNRARPFTRIFDEYTHTFGINDHDHSPWRKTAGAARISAAVWRHARWRAGRPFVKCAWMATSRRTSDFVRIVTNDTTTNRHTAIHLCGQSGQRFSKSARRSGSENWNQR